MELCLFCTLWEGSGGWKDCDISLLLLAGTWTLVVLGMSITHVRFMHEQGAMFYTSFSEHTYAWYDPSTLLKWVCRQPVSNSTSFYAYILPCIYILDVSVKWKVFQSFTGVCASCRISWHRIYPFSFTFWLFSVWAQFIFSKYILGFKQCINNVVTGKGLSVHVHCTCTCITQYGSTVYIGIAMVYCHWKPYIRFFITFTFSLLPTGLLLT